MKEKGKLVPYHKTNEDIYRQNKKGQISFVKSDTLPICVRYNDGYNHKAIFKACGIELFEVVGNDPLFCFAKLPQGWRKEKTDEVLWSNLLDGEGRERARIFFEAAIGRRNAFMYLSTRFNFRLDDFDRFKKNVIFARIKDCGKLIHTIHLIPPSSDDYDVVKWANSCAYEWLDKNYPDWRNPAAHWDSPTSK